MSNFDSAMTCGEPQSTQVVQQRRSTSLHNILLSLLFLPFSILRTLFYIPLTIAYQIRVINFHVIEFFISILFAQPLPDLKSLDKGRVAIIGGGLTGVSAAATCVVNGFDVVIFEKEDGIGGIWKRVHDVSKLQTPGIMYRPHPLVFWNKIFPSKYEILEQIHRVWKDYGLSEKTRLNTTVWDVIRVKETPDGHEESSYHQNGQGNHAGDSKANNLPPDAKAKWIINGNKDEQFDAVIACIGTCEKLQIPPFPGQENLQIPFHHSSQLSGGAGDGWIPEEKRGKSSTEVKVNLRGKRVLVVGSGASAIESLEYALECNAVSVDVISRHHKWILPRSLPLLSLLALFPRRLSFIPEFLLKLWYHINGCGHMIPSKPLYSASPCCNSNLFRHVRSGFARFFKGKVLSFWERGIIIEEQSGTEKKEIKLEADVIVFATGFERPSLEFITGEKADQEEEEQPKNDGGRDGKHKKKKKKKKSNAKHNGQTEGARDENKENPLPSPYSPPNLYLQTFSVVDPTLLMVNSSFRDAIGTVGHFHIGIYTRMLLMHLLDRGIFPKMEDRCQWVDEMLERYEDGLSFFNYGQLLVWFVRLMIMDWRRWKWIPFVFFGFKWSLEKYPKQAHT